MTKTIVRAPRRRRYLVVDQTLVDDDRLSLAARGLLLTILSKPDDWKVCVDDLRRRCRLGRDSIYNLLNELKDVGYVHYLVNRTADGRMAGGTYHVYEHPEAALRAAPLPDYPEAVEPDPVNPEAIPNTEKNLVPTTTTTVVGGSGGSDKHAEELIFPGELLEAERSRAENCVSELDACLRQTVLDELAGIMKAGKIRASPLACLEGIVRHAKAGAFTPQFAPRVEHARKERRRAERAYERALSGRPGPDGGRPGGGTEG